MTGVPASIDFWICARTTAEPSMAQYLHSATIFRYDHSGRGSRISFSYRCYYSNVILS